MKKESCTKPLLFEPFNKTEEWNANIVTFLMWRMLCISKQIYQKYFGEVCFNSMLPHNCIPSSLLKGKSPFELLHNQSPLYSYIKVFGCLAYAYDHNMPNDKFRAHSHPCVFLGCPFGKKWWRFYNIKHKKFIISRDVVFDESIFPYVTEKLENTNSMHGIQGMRLKCLMRRIKIF